MRWWDEERNEESATSDSVLLGRHGPVADDEADRFEAVCRAATPGPLVVDDTSEAEGVVVASLPDGRYVLSKSEEVVTQADAAATAEANAELICRARPMILRLLRDRQHWRRREESLLARIRSLEAKLEREDEACDAEEWKPAEQVPISPR